MFTKGQKVRIVDDSFGGVTSNGLKKGDIVTIAAIHEGGEFVSVAEGHDVTRRYFSRRFEAIAPPKELYLAVGADAPEATDDAGDFAADTQVEVYQLVRVGTVKPAQVV